MYAAIAAALRERYTRAGFEPFVGLALYQSQDHKHGENDSALAI
jgi:hypothetical protein